MRKAQGVSLSEELWKVIDTERNKLTVPCSRSMFIQVSVQEFVKKLQRRKTNEEGK